MICIHTGAIVITKYSFGDLFDFFMFWFCFKAGMFHKTELKITHDLLVHWSKCLLIPATMATLYGLIFYLHRMYTHDYDLYKILKDTVIITLYNGSSWCNKPVWFLICLFFVRCLSGLLNKGMVLFLLLPLSLAIAYLHSIYSPIEVFNYIGYISLAFSFYCLGVLLKNVQYLKSVFLLSMIIFIFLSILFPSYLDMRCNMIVFGNYFIAILTGATGIITINNIFRKNAFIGRMKTLCFVGRNSMAFLLLHWPIYLLISDSLLIAGWQVMIPILSSIICIGLSIAFVFFLEKYPRLKWIIGS